MLKNLIAVFMWKKIASWRNVELKYSPKDLHEPYIISNEKHIYFTFCHDSLHKGVAQLFVPDKVRKSIEKV